jgi:hypothetical protein
MLVVALMFTLATARSAPAQCEGQWLTGASHVQPGVQAGRAVHSLALHPDGGWIVGGKFTQAGGVSANFIARWNGAAWSPLGAGTNGWVNCIATLPDGSIVAGGEFTSAGGFPAGRVAQWDGKTWQALGSGPGLFGSVNAIAVRRSRQ